MAALFSFWREATLRWHPKSTTGCSSERRLRASTLTATFSNISNKKQLHDLTDVFFWFYTYTVYAPRMPSICTSWHVFGVPQEYLYCFCKCYLFVLSGHFVSMDRIGTIYFFKVATPEELSICVDSIYWFRCPWVWMPSTVFVPNGIWWHVKHRHIKCCLDGSFFGCLSAPSFCGHYES